MTIVVPTLWTPKAQITLPQSIRSLSRQEGVSQIVLINNSETPLPIELSSLPKVEYVQPPSNLFVNASWNLGASMATSEHLTILNDDIVIAECLVPAMNQFLKEQDALVGCSSIMPIDAPEPMANHVNLYRVPGMSYGFGCCMSLRTSSYHQIPDCIKIWYGDNYLEQKFLRAGKPMYRPATFLAKGFVETTSHCFPSILHADHTGWKQVKWD